MPSAASNSDGDTQPLAKVKRSDLPFGSEFSPSQIDLPRLLDIIDSHDGDWHSLEAAVQKQYFSGHGKRSSKGGAYNRAKLANNCKLGLIAYRIIDRDGNFTAFGRELHKLRSSPNALYEALAKHILLHLLGMSLIQCIRDMTAADEEINLTTLREGLEARSVHYPRGGKHPSIMRLWLAKAGVFVGSRWQIDEIRLQEILGTDPSIYTQLANFTAEQRAFLRALANTGVSTPQPANEIARLAAASYGVKFPEKSLPKLVLNALVEAGYITAKKTTEGRGAKPFLVTPTSKLVGELIEPLFKQLTNQTDPKLLALLRKPLEDILRELHSQSRYQAGLALEALAFKLMRLLDMDYVATRLRASSTGGAEVDLIFESARLIFSRWQIQCKNTKYVALDDVAKEVGLTHFIKSNVVVVVTTGSMSGEARKYANKIMTDSNLAIVMIDGADLARINKRASQILDVFAREAQGAMKLKKLDLGE